MIFKILSIKFRSPKSIKFLNEPKGHLALRLNDTKVLESEELLELIEYVGSVFGVKFLTLISGKLGFEREIDLNGNENISLYHNYENLLKRDNSVISVNLVDHDSESLFLSKLKESMKCEDYEINYKSAVESFTNFPPIDLFLCMTRSLNFTKLHPLHLSFTQFYCCPVLVDQSYSKEAITEGFELFSKTKQNFGK